MGYSTDFSGGFTITPALTAAQVRELEAFAERRHDEGGDRPVPAGESWRPGLPREVTPGIWCQWVPSPEGDELRWDQGEKFYDYVEWLGYVIEHFMRPWGRALDGQVEWMGDDSDDAGKIIVADNVISIAEQLEPQYGEPKEVQW